MYNILSDKFVTTRKPHRCDACGRHFPKGTKMRRQVNAEDGICQWYECPTCEELLGKYRGNFDDGYGMCEQFCVQDALNKDETPEEMLERLKSYIAPPNTTTLY